MTPAQENFQNAKNAEAANDFAAAAHFYKLSADAGHGQAAFTEGAWPL